MRNDFVAFILSNGRADKVHTYNTLKKHGYTGKIIIVIDNEDNTSEKYYEIFGKENIYMFDKKEVAKTFDEADNFDDRRTIVYARNACFDIAKELGYQYFIQLDDDYTEFRFQFNNSREFITKKIAIKKIDNVLEAMIDFFIEAKQITSIAMSQGGDFIGGGNGKFAKDYMDGKLIRKAMNSFICSVDRPFKFQGRINEDVNTYTNLQNRGSLFLTFARINLQQKQTQSNSGGMTDVYLASGTYLKSFYTVMFQPSSVKIGMMGTTNPRLHHHVKWEKTTPFILDEKYKK